MYKWNKDKMESYYEYHIRNNSNIASSYNVLFSNSKLMSKVNRIFNDDLLLRIATSAGKILSSELFSIHLFYKMINQDKIDVKVESTYKDFNFEEKDVVELVRAFTYSINNYLGFRFDSMTSSSNVQLEKNNISNGMFFRDEIFNESFINVKSPNKADMAYILIHEFGHSLYNNFSSVIGFPKETVPILLELYFTEFLKANGIHLDVYPILQRRFVEDVNMNTDTLKTFFNVYTKRDDKDYVIRELRRLNNEYGVILNTLPSFGYLFSEYKAIDIYNKTYNPFDELVRLVREEIKANTIRDIVVNTNNGNNDIISLNNIQTIKKLVKRK